MTSAFFGLGIGASALKTAQTLTDIANQNIANASTPGYSRQSATVTASTPYPVPVLSGSGVPGQLGTGVQITAVTRAVNSFVNSQINAELSVQGQVGAQSTALTQAEGVINEPSTTGLSSTMTAYWSAWQNVANTPTDPAIRGALLQTGVAVADNFQNQVSQFKAQQQGLDQQIAPAVTTVNSLAKQLAALNGQIVQVSATGMQPNDLMDQRDLLVNQLSSLVKVSVSTSANGSMNVNIGNHQLVAGTAVNQMVANATSGAFTQVQWANGTTAAITGSTAAQPIGTGGTLSINGINVTLTAGHTAAQTVADINQTFGLGSTGTATASLSSTGTLVLTANTTGATGVVSVGAASGAGNTIAADLGLTPGGPAVTGTDGTAVSLGGGSIQGTIDSRDGLLQERIDDANTLASRVIESVNSLQSSGAGLDGSTGTNFFSGTDATNIAVSSQLTAPNGTDKIAAGRLVADPTAASGYSAAAGDSSNAIAIAELANVNVQAATGGSNLAPGQALSPATVLGMDLSGAASNKTYTFSMTAGTPPTVSVSDGTTTTQATITVGSDSATPPNSIINLDSGTTRLTLSAPNGTTLNAALAGLNGPPNASISTTSSTATVGDEYAQQIASLGVESQTAQTQSSNQTVLLNQLKNQQQQTSGVSLDEETVNLITDQKAYEAAARIITTMDSMLDTLINHTGLMN